MSQSIVNIMSNNSENYKIKHTDFGCIVNSPINNVISMELLYCIIPSYFDIIHDLNDSFVIELTNIKESQTENVYLLITLDHGTPVDFASFRKHVFDKIVERNGALCTLQKVGSSFDRANVFFVFHFWAHHIWK